MDAKKVIVTGGAGFIGSHTSVELAEAGYEPIVIDDYSNSDRSVVDRVSSILSRPVAAVELDCNDRAGMARVFAERGPIFGVIHFAAHKAVGESVSEPIKYYRNNVGSLLCLLDVMHEHQVANLVFSSSCTVYGQPDQLPVTEATAMKPAESPYGRTKQICEGIIDDVVTSGRALSAVTLRYFNPIGAHPSSQIGELPLGPPENLIPYITQTAAGLRDRLTVFGGDYDTPDGTCIRDYIHVVDLARAHVSALQWLERRAGASGNEVFNVGTGRGSSVREVIDAFEAVSGQKLPVVMGARRPGDVVQTYAAVDKARSELGWTARLTLRDALRDAWAWQRSLSQR